MSTRLIDFLLDRNKKQSEEFLDSALTRRQYRAQHPTEIAALKCMDGRLNLSVMTKTPPGIIQPYRNIGGKFDLGWPYFGTLLRQWVEYSISKGRDCVILNTYHFSKGDSHRGCAGFGYDTENAKKRTGNLVLSLEDFFGRNNSPVYSIHVGIETDDESLVFHGKYGDTLDLANEPKMSKKEIFEKIKKLFPDIKESVAEDLVPLVVGNQEHIQEIRNSNRPIEDANHKEQILAIGRGFDWLHLPNKALIIGPYSFDLVEPIAIAAGLLLKNIEEGRIPKDVGIILMTSAVYRNRADLEYKQAIAKTRSFARFALKVIEEKVPRLKDYIYTQSLMGVVDLNTREFHRVYDPEVRVHENGILSDNKVAVEEN